MTFIKKLVEVPFESCQSCNKFTMDVDSLEMESFDGDFYNVETYKCHYKDICENAIAVTNKEER